MGAAAPTRECVEFTVIAIEPQQNRADALPALVDPIADRHTVGVSMVLDLDHLSFALDVGAVEAFGDHDLAKVEAIMGNPIPWARDLPLRGDGFETEYYMKEID